MPILPPTPAIIVTKMDPFMVICALRNFRRTSDMRFASNDMWTRTDLFEAAIRWGSEHSSVCSELRDATPMQLALRKGFHDSLCIPYVRSDMGKTCVSVSSIDNHFNFETIREVLCTLERTGSVNMTDLRAELNLLALNSAMTSAGVAAFVASPLMLAASVVSFILEAEVAGIVCALGAVAACVSAARTRWSCQGGIAK